MTLRFFRQILVCVSVLALGLTFLYFQKIGSAPLSSSSEIASNTYLGPIRPIPGDPLLVRLEILVYDSPQANGLQIVSVTFDGTDIPLKPRDIYGARGTASFQMQPGVYKLQWVVNRDKFAWPRRVEHEETVTINPRDLWLQISIEGDTASIR